MSTRKNEREKMPEDKLKAFKVMGENSYDKYLFKALQKLKRQKERENFKASLNVSAMRKVLSKKLLGVDKALDRMDKDPEKGDRDHER